MPQAANEQLINDNPLAGHPVYNGGGSLQGGRDAYLSDRVIAVALSAPLAAQWLNQPTPGIPRTPDGKRNLAAPAPRTPDGRPDLSGLWNKISPTYSRNIALRMTDYVEQPPLWRAAPRVVEITLLNGRLLGDMDGRGKVPLIASSETAFSGLYGLGVEFIQGGSGGLFVKHVSGNYRFARK